MAGDPNHPVYRAGIRSRLAALCGTCLILFSGCGESDGSGSHPIVPPAERYEANSSPESVWRNLVRTYEDQDYARFEPLFDCARFGFETVEPGAALGDTLDCEAVKRTAQDAFSDPALDRIEIQSGIQLVELAEEADRLPFASDDVVKFTLFLHAEVHLVNDAGEPVEFLFDGDGVEVYFRQYPLELASDGKPVWKFVYWRGPRLLGLLGIAPQP